mgnify:FL=1
MPTTTNTHFFGMNEGKTLIFKEYKCGWGRDLRTPESLKIGHYKTLIIKRVTKCYITVESPINPYNHTYKILIREDAVGRKYICHDWKMAVYLDDFEELDEYVRGLKNKLPVDFCEDIESAAATYWGGRTVDSLGDAQDEYNIFWEDLEDLYINSNWHGRLIKGE